MLADKPEQATGVNKSDNKGWRSLLRFIVSIGLGLLALWFVSRDVNFAEVGISLREARLSLVFGGIAIIILTAVIKAWRWQQLFAPRANAPALTDLFWSMLLGQFINVMLWRLGDLARTYDLNQRTGRSKTLILSTIVVEKSLHLLFVLLTLVLVLPFIVVPQLVQTPAEATAWVLVPLLIAMYALAYQTERVIALIRRIASYLPASLENRLLKLAVSGLEGLAALRDRRTLTGILLSSTGIALLEIATPLVLFRAFDFTFGIREATVLNLTLILGSVPPTTPLKIGVFEWLTMFVLAQFGELTEAVQLSYALVFHGVVLLPALTLGIIAAQRSQWTWPRWRR